MSAARSRPLTGRRVLAIFAAGFGVVFAVNAVFVFLALTSWTGLDTEEAYVKGLKYEETLARAEAQKALGWSMDWVLTEELGGRVFAVRLHDKRRLPVFGVTLTAELRRPTHEREDVSFVLAPHGDGVFRSEAQRIAPGNWNMTVLVDKEGETVFRREDRLFLK